MITNKDIRVENGNLVLNGDKYPLDGQSPETIMQIVEDNSDTTPTENSDAPITSGGVYTALGTKQDTLTFDDTPTDESTNPVTSGGVFSALAPILAKVNFIFFNPLYNDWNDYPDNCVGFGVTGHANNPGKNSFVICMGSSNAKIQIAFSADVSQQKYRVYIDNAWTAWTSF